MIWKTTFALLVDKATLFFNKKNCAQPPSFFKTLTILLIFSGCFFNFSTGYSQTVPDGNFNATEYSDAQTSAVDSNASTTCDVVKVLATINNDIPADPYLLLGFQVGNGGNAIFRYYFDTDGKSIGTDRFANKEIVVGDADLVVQINTNNSNSLEVLKWDGTSFQTSATNFGIKAAVGDFAPGDSRFLEVKIPLGAGSVIDICNLVGGNSIQLGKYISVKGGNLNSNLCPHPPLVFDIALSGVISGGKEYCSGKYIPTELALNGSFGNVVDWEKNEGNGWVSVGNIPTIAGNYTPSDVTVTTRYRAIIVSAVCANLKIPSQEATITINTLDNASFSYSGSPYCVDGTDVTPTVTGVSGGSFNSTTGLIINSTTGVIDLDASTPGPYTIIYSTDNAGTCTNISTQSITIVGTPAAPVAGEVTQPTCTTATGSFQIADFDADSDYDFSPNVVSISDSGLVTATAGDYSFTLTNEAKCISPASENIKVNEQLDTPAAPVAGEVTQPTCTTATGSFQIADFDADSDYDFTPSVVSISDSGLVTANAGDYSFTVTNEAGCISPASENIKVNEQLDTPAAPVAGEVTQPTCTTATGSFQIADFDADSDYDFTPGVVSISDSGLVTANAGDYSFTVTNEAGCISPASENVKVNEQLDTPAAPVAGTVTQPTCTTATGSFQIADFDADSDYDFTPGVVSVSDSGLVTANAGNYSFTVTNAAGCISPASENLEVNEQLNTPAAPVAGTVTQPTCDSATELSK
ncbi:hypothetical protein [Gillisia limnaea]|uniref:Uncharacterized protein n=1 Tax=Gillisia limnaea (strain DSM 15749 / LMG 21470 / R-8282) TaxID=865937 RepID=H2BZS6_GILLR|nr:hypothetical protein [Gillisia limnaea]EHQ01268.1 hypothetical protein Gilli_0556 [Gillisia limnaea DSM 15749]